MRSLVYLVAASLDGRIAAADGSIDAFGAFGGDLARDLLEEFPEMLPGHLREAFGVTAPNRRFDTAVMGHATYAPAPAAGITSPYAHLRQIVVSRSMRETPDPAIEVVGEDVVARVRALKREPGRDVWLVGGGRLAAALAGEIDELVLKISPVVLGDGIPMFAGDAGSFAVEVTGRRAYASGHEVVRGRPVREPR